MGLAILISSAHTAHFNSEGQELSNSDQDNDSKNKMDTRVMQKKKTKYNFKSNVVQNLEFRQQGK